MPHTYSIVRCCSIFISTCSVSGMLKGYIPSGPWLACVPGIIFPRRSVSYVHVCACGSHHECDSNHVVPILMAVYYYYYRYWYICTCVDTYPIAQVYWCPHVNHTSLHTVSLSTQLGKLCDPCTISLPRGPHWCLDMIVALWLNMINHRSHLMCVWENPWCKASPWLWLIKNILFVISWIVFHAVRCACTPNTASWLQTVSNRLEATLLAHSWALLGVMQGVANTNLILTVSPPYFLYHWHIHTQHTHCVC